MSGNLKDRGHLDSRSMKAIMVAILLMLPGALAISSVAVDNEVSASRPDRTYTTTDTVPPGFVPIYTVDDLLKAGSGITSNGSDNIQYDWDLDDDYILMNDLVFTGSEYIGTEFMVKITLDNGNFQLDVRSSNSTDVEGTVWINSNSGVITGGQSTVQASDGPYRITLGGLADGEPFAYGFDIDEMTEGTPVQRVFNVQGNFSPIGSDADPFLGIFNGNGHTIAGMEVQEYVQSGTSSSVGMFSHISGDAKIHDLLLVNASVYFVSASSDPSNKNFAVGTIVGNASGSASIINCSSSGSVRGGILDPSSSVNTILSVGGMAGVLSDSGVMEKCDYTGTATSTASSSTVNSKIYSGGVTGMVDTTGPSKMDDCTSSGISYTASAIVAGSIMSYMGGIVGIVNATDEFTISGCYSDMSLDTSNSTVSQNVYSVAGGIAGRFGGTSVVNCTNEGDIRSYANVDSVASNSTQSINAVGGVTGWMQRNQTVLVDDCVNTGNIQAISEAAVGSFDPVMYLRAGGIAGHVQGNSPSKIAGCSNEGSLDTIAIVKNATNVFNSNNSYDVGGILAACTYADMEVSDCSNGASINVRSRGDDSMFPLSPNVGGIIGAMKGNMETNSMDGCTNKGDITVEVSGNKINSETNAIPVTNDVNAGGMIGYGFGVTISACMNFGSLDAVLEYVLDFSQESLYIGGIGGYLYLTIVEDCRNESPITAEARLKAGPGNVPIEQDVPSAFVAGGGIAGLIGSSEVKGCSNSGDVVLMSFSDLTSKNRVQSYAGGLAGQVHFWVTTSSVPVTFDRCGNSGDVTSISETASYVPISIAGGLMGRVNSHGTMLTSCYNTGKVDAVSSSGGRWNSESYAGGLMGYVGSSGVAIKYTYSVGEVSSTSENGSAGAFAGYSADVITTRYCFMLDSLSCGMNGTVVSDDIGSCMRSGSEMKAASTFETWPNFHTIWSLDADGSVNGGFPYFNDLPDRTHVISFNTNGGSDVNSATASTGEMIALPVPEKEGYDFKGWFTNPNGSGEAHTTFSVYSDMVFYAMWENAGGEPNNEAYSLLILLICLLLVIVLLILFTKRRELKNETHWYNFEKEKRMKK